jgi:hypothetical protein
LADHTGRAQDADWVFVLHGSKHSSVQESRRVFIGEEHPGRSIPDATGKPDLFEHRSKTEFWGTTAQREIASCGTADPAPA